MPPRGVPALLLVAASFAWFAVRNGALGDLVELACYATVAAGALALALALRHPAPRPRLLLAGSVLLAGGILANDAAYFAAGGAYGSATGANLLWAWGLGLAGWHGARWALGGAPGRRAAGMRLGLALAGLGYAAYLVLVATRLGLQEPVLLGAHAAGLAAALLVALPPATASPK